MNSKQRILIRVLVTIVSLFLIIYFQSQTGISGLLHMLLGLTGLLLVVYDYNRGYK